MRLDSVIRAETPEGIALALRPAGLPARGGAYLIDLAIRLGIFFVISMVAAVAGGMGAALLLISYFLLEWFYPVLFELAASGATPGKQVMGLQVVMDSGLPVTASASLLRNLLRAADFLPALYGTGIACLLGRADGKRLGDLAAGTLVVHVQPAKLHGPVPPATPVAPLRPLKREEQAAVLAWAGRASRLTAPRFEELASIARPIIPPGARGETEAKGLLGVAQWILGRRE